MFCLDKSCEQEQADDDDGGCVGGGDGDLARACKRLMDTTKGIRDHG